MHHPLVKQIARFLIVGGASVLVDLLVYRWLLGEGLAPHPAKGMSYVAGMLLGFLGNKFWTFEARPASLREPLVYALLYAFTLGVNIALNGAVLMLLGASHTLAAFIFATGVTTMINFLGMKFLTFRRSVAVA